MNLTPKEKAKELVEKYQSGYTIGRFSYQLPNDLQDAKQCALVACNEIIDAIDWHEFETPNKQLNYWLDVRKELEKNY